MPWWRPKNCRKRFRDGVSNFRSAVLSLMMMMMLMMMLMIKKKTYADDDDDGDDGDNDDHLVGDDAGDDADDDAEAGLPTDDGLRKLSASPMAAWVVKCCNQSVLQCWLWVCQWNLAWDWTCIRGCCMALFRNILRRTRLIFSSWCVLSIQRVAPYFF